MPELLTSFVLDTWQYFWHRYFHTNTFLYRHVHSIHHRLYVPYAFGALYNHPLEGFVLDTLGAAIAHSCSFMTMRQGIFFFAVSTAKTVDDHCGFAFPWDPIQHLFGNNADYHDIHRELLLVHSVAHELISSSLPSDQIAGLKKNFSQPYFIHFECVASSSSAPLCAFLNPHSLQLLPRHEDDSSRVPRGESQSTSEAPTREGGRGRRCDAGGSRGSPAAEDGVGTSGRAVSVYTHVRTGSTSLHDSLSDTPHH